MKTRAKTRFRGFSARKTELQGVLGKNQGFMCKNQKVLGADMQKDLNWTAGSISKKLKGLNIKNRAWIEILLNTTGPRVEFRKTREVFSKSTRR